jgi:CheY-like chemotaxis protein
VKLRATLSVALNGTPRVVANEARLGQVFLNLLINAVQAVPEGSPTRNRIQVRTRVQESEVQIEFSDSGAGIPEELLPRIFDPFFTTKPAGEGTGLGLFLARQIVADYGGTLSVSSPPGSGAHFVIRFPLAATTSEDTLAHSPVSEAPSQSPPRAKILIVDDEVRLAASMQMLLEDEHDVVTASSGYEALELLISRKERFDVVLCDLQMPDVSGMDVHRRLAEVDPDGANRMIFYSGGAYSPEARQFVQTVKNTILMKPIPPEQLFVTIRDALRRSAG